MSIITLGDLKLLWQNVSDWVTGSNGTYKPNVQLTGSSIQDSQAVPMTQAQKDIAAQAYSNIIDIIGAQNIISLLPMWETSGTVAKDLINPSDVQFDIVGATLGQQGLLHPAMSFDGATSYLKEKPRMTYKSTSITGYSFNSPTNQVAQQITLINIGYDIGLVTFNLKVVGTLTSATTLTLTILNDNSGIPGSVIATSNPLDCSQLPTDNFIETGFNFSSNPYLDCGMASNNFVKKYWLVLSYNSTPEVNASNYVLINNDTNATGQTMATYDGTSWTTSSNNALLYNIYDIKLSTIPNSFSVGIVCAPFKKPSDNTFFQLGSAASSSVIRLSNGTLASYVNGNLHFNIGNIAPGFSKCIPYNIFNVFYVVFDNPNGKCYFYFNGVNIYTVSFTANQTIPPRNRPAMIGGAFFGDKTSILYYGAGVMSSFIYSTGVLSASQIGQITNELLGLRKYQVGV